MYHTKEEKNKKITVVKNIKINELHNFAKPPLKVESDMELFELMKRIAIKHLITLIA
ncbi:hypothetical protein BXY41_1102 [Lacrimispora xylanisolvens]|uniref:Uncharacterized protein n=1 Tax=Lacrimispora xylanisolvens TaxID=384636 RepID=A0A2S6HP08_9FIRM|nr:hypothetical protein BXY41_1102 [Hungatella xylanolytica]